MATRTTKPRESPPGAAKPRLRGWLLCLFAAMLASCGGGATNQTGQSQENPQADSGPADGGAPGNTPRDAGHDADAASPDAMLEPTTFCAWLEAGARFQSVELLWCDSGWPGEDPEPTCEEEPGYCCHWTAHFEGTQLEAIYEDYGYWATYTCEGNTFATAPGSSAGRWDPRRQVLVFFDVEYVSEGPVPPALRSDAGEG